MQPDFLVEVTEVPIGREQFFLTARRLCTQPHFALLESSGDKGRYSFLAVDPFITFISEQDKFTIDHFADGKRCGVGDPLDELGYILDLYSTKRPVTGPAFPFYGGGIGWFSYEMGRRFERYRKNHRENPDLPEAYWCFYDQVLIFDPLENKCFMSAIPGIRGPEKESRLNEAVSSVLNGERPRTAGLKHRPVHPPVIHKNMSMEKYVGLLNIIKERIWKGDVYQVNLTQRFETDLPKNRQWEFFRELMSINPAPFSSFLRFGDATILSSSPERFLKVDGKAVEARPIKGTIRRSDDHAEDLRLAQILLKSEKNRAELAMIVDLMRNDLGRVCVPGSVKTGKFPELESFSSVHHLVCSVTGELMPGKTVIDLIRASFPGGSITGAPKIKAMEIIEELEPVERGIYTGSIGYLGFDGLADLNIAIRTAIIKGETAYIHSGGGITADSDPVEEYDESLLKAQRLFEAFQISTDEA